MLTPIFVTLQLIEISCVPPEARTKRPTGRAIMYLWRSAHVARGLSTVDASMSVHSLLRLLLLGAIWGGSYVFMRIAVPAFGPLTTTFLRVCIAALGMAVIVRTVVSTEQRGFDGKLPAAMMVGAINSGLPFLLFAFAAKSLPAGYSAILNATAPLMGAVIGSALFGERMTAWKAGGVLLGLIGVAVLTQAGPVDSTPSVWIAVGGCLVGAACYGLAVFLARRWIHDRGGLDSNVVAFGSQLGAVVFLTPFMAVAAGLAPTAKTALTLEAWMSVLALGLICTCLAYVLYFRLINDIGPMRSLTVAFLIPVFGVFWGWLALDENVSWAHLIGGGLVGVAVWLVLGLRLPKIISRVNTP